MFCQAGFDQWRTTIKTHSLNLSLFVAAQNRAK
jgi:hypothetical protein